MISGKDLEELRSKSNMTQAEISEALGISLRTLLSWVQKGKDFILPKTSQIAIQMMLEENILTHYLQEFANLTFKEIPSEFIGVWLVKRNFFSIQSIKADKKVQLSETVVLLKNTARFQCLKTDDKFRNNCKWKEYCTKDEDNYFCFRNNTVHKEMNENSMVVQPLRSGKTIRLAGDDIVDSPYKLIPNRSNMFYHDQICHSILHIPYFFESERGPLPMLLCSIENKLEKAKEQWKVKKFKENERGIAYTPDDEEKAIKQIESFFGKDDIIKIFSNFGYLKVPDKI